MQLRPYQEEARAKVQQEWKEGRKRTLLVLSTGCGKTIVFSKIIEERVKMGERVLVLAHRSELLEQASDKLMTATGLGTALEKAENTSIGSWFRVVVGSVQTMQREKRLSQFPPNHFDTIVIDEAHHAISDGYQRVLEHFGEANVLGVTATPDRGDMRNLGSYFDSLAYEYPLVDAIKSGYLSKITAITIPLELDLSTVSQQGGDFKASEIGTALDPYLEQIADEMVKQCKDRKTVVFLPLVKTSQKFRDILNAKGFKAAEVNGESKDRAEILEDFDKDKYNVLCNSMLLTEGWDCPTVD
ncbi:MAG: DEAD/DEAH box helicase, partial [Streptococcus sp.]|nr:DEAD/DEAH box helicase [Streptococcus sp.]